MFPVFVRDPHPYDPFVPQTVIALICVGSVVDLAIDGVPLWRIAIVTLLCVSAGALLQVLGR